MHQVGETEISGEGGEEEETISTFILSEFQTVIIILVPEREKKYIK